MKHSRPGTAAGGEDPKAEPQQSQELWVTFPVGPGDSTAAPSGKGDWENTPQPFFQLEVFPRSWNKDFPQGEQYPWISQRDAPAGPAVPQFRWNLQTWAKRGLLLDSAAPSGGYSQPGAFPTAKEVSQSLDKIFPALSGVINSISCNPTLIGLN